jgi:hypothetical protein
MKAFILDLFSTFDLGICKAYTTDPFCSGQSRNAMTYYIISSKNELLIMT